MIKKIAHLSDIHIHNDINKYQHQKEALQNTIDSIKSQSDIDRIVIVGDLFHNFIKPTNEAKELAGWFLNELSKLVDSVIITMGNHDYNGKSKLRLDSIQTVVNLLNNSKIKYLNRTFLYDDDNIVWCVWHHSDKTSPWTDELIKNKDKNKFYIDLFHDPVFGCKNYFNEVFNKKNFININDFHGDIGMFGDIHHRQYFEKTTSKIKPFAAYPSSLYQNNFGESPDRHGYLIWEIIDNKEVKVSEVDIDTNYIYLNYYINKDINKLDFDYSKIDITLPETRENTYLKIHWTDYSVNINPENERNIVSYIKQKYPEVKDLKFKKDRLNTNKIEKEDLFSQSLKNINDTNVQREIFIEYLKNNKYDDDFITEVIELDHKINERLGIVNKDNSYNWQVLSFYLDNYRSHGERTDINWNEQDGIWQIRGVNGSGKTNLMSALCYLFYGKTLETLKRKSNGDLRFINKYRDVDYSEVGAVLRINGNLYSIVRKTERNWDKSKTKISNTPTTISYKIIDENHNVISTLTDEQKTETQKIIEESLGSFEDFLRTSLVNADTLNGLLTMDEASFIDNILRDSGLDVFELKLNEYKELKKELKTTEERLNIDVTKVREKIKSNEEKVVEYKSEITELEEKIKINEARLEKGIKVKDDEIKKLSKIDDTLKELNVIDLENNINKLIEEKSQKDIEYNLLIDKINNMDIHFNEDEYNYLVSNSDKLKNEVLELRNKIKEEKNNVDNTKQQISIKNGEIINTQKSMDNILAKINYEKTVYNGNIETLKNKITDNLTLIEKEKVRTDQEIKNTFDLIEKEKSRIDKEIKELENSKICPTCKRDLEEDHIQHVQEIIKQKELSKTNSEYILTCQKTIKEKEESKENSEYISNCLTDNKKNEIEIAEIKVKLLDEKTLFKAEYESFKEKESIIDNIKIAINELKELLITQEENIPKYEENLSNIYNNQSVNDEKLKEVEDIKKQLEEKNNLINKKDNFPLVFENLDLKINQANTKLSDYKENENKLKLNEAIEININKFTEAITKLYNEKQQYISNIDQINNIHIDNLNKENIQYEINIEKYLKQERNDNIHKVYQNCIHRDGIPKLMLLKMRDEINNEITKLLANVDFNVFFDENMTLKMCNNNTPNILDDVISGCGMERTFISVVLRLALRKVNNKSIGNLLFLDEITGKLVDESVSKFFELLHTAKNDIEKILIIEHAYSEELNPDYIIDVTIENNVSNIKLI